jgi:hypothetical protein
MENQHDTEIKLEMDIADFSSKTVKRIDIQNIVSRADPHKMGIAVVMSFTDGATGTILVRSRDVTMTADPYARPRMANYSIVEDPVIAQAP